ncbi:PDZ domain-containing protein [Neolecta irregularis DAH-3]|uniref:PDZ domain-containing protein n=1 Tax=Neolecta irregularis (strain DAH-3) TaxID=1198029 RepID=A0A1U7LWM1_NEOID|nr:PDZ domain-containing protein [Neolecta irregularis DAH-3]|eukprot:OLL27067.1 PDZ domain-containing protein [Neolecta irregularis DAH-3]
MSHPQFIDIPGRAISSGKFRRQSIASVSPPDPYGSASLLRSNILAENYFSSPPVIHNPQISQAQQWDLTLEKAIRSIVSIKASTLRAFDTESAGNYTATGFIVDKQRGIILSNRHVVSPAPISAAAVFCNYEEIPLVPLYRDPVHDFGFFKYDPAKVRFLEYDDIELCPDLAKVGLDIKVVGNDAGEKLSILGSTLARLDRDSPNYGSGSYNDFNTFYYQAASGTSGGSSGSPVLNIHGQAVALNAGGSNKSASSFYLPLNRVIRALRCLQQGLPITRGTLQTEFRHSSYDELRRLGLRTPIEAECRRKNPSATGRLTVDRVLLQGPGDGVLEPGDILMSCAIGGDNKDITQFYTLWEIIDDNIGKEITFNLCRGQKSLDVKVMIQDLHSITPSRFAEIGGAIIHDLSYQKARPYDLPVSGSGAFIATSGMFNWSSTTRDFLITSINGHATPNLDKFIEAVKLIPDGKRIPLRYRDMDRQEEEFSLLEIDWHFHSPFIFTRNDNTGVWDVEKILRNLGPLHPVRDIVSSGNALEKIQSTMVSISCRLPYSIHGYTSSSPYSGVGFVISNNPPLVICDRVCVPSEVVDLRITICNRTVKAQVVHLCTVAILTFDGECNLDIPAIDEDPVSVHDSVILFTLDHDQQLIKKESKVSSISLIETRRCYPPRFRVVNTEGIMLTDSSNNGGIIVRQVDEEYRVVALWGNVSSQGNDKAITWKTGISFSTYINPVLEMLRKKVTPVSKDVGVEFSSMQLATAVGLGLTNERTDQLVAAAKVHNGNPRAFYVSSRLRPSMPTELQVGDVVFQINGKLVSRASDFAVINTNEVVDIGILRNGIEQILAISTIVSPPSHAKKIVSWAGALLHETHAAALEQVSSSAVPAAGVYVCCCHYGSPSIDQFRPAHWIIQVDDEKVSFLDELEQIISGKTGEVMVKLINRKGITCVVSIKIDNLFWPSWKLERKGSVWQQSLL